MDVQLLSYTRNPAELVYAAARQCYSRESAVRVFYGAPSADRVASFVRTLVAKGHESPLEHAAFTFGIHGVSRVTTHQLVRHRVASYSQQSQRYVTGIADLVVPPSVQRLIDDGNETVQDAAELAVAAAHDAYNALLQAGVPAEDARYFLPSGCASSLVVTMNARELRHVFSVRLCNRAQWEIRELAAAMREAVLAVAAPLFEDTGPACARGDCPEGEMTCGRPWLRHA